mgnify:CR=1 FL=1
MERILEERLAACLDEAVRPFSFTRLDRTPAVEGISLAAAWKYKTLNMNRGVALLTLKGSEGHAGEVPQKDITVSVEIPPQNVPGDLASNLPMALAKWVKKPPRYRPSLWKR